MWWAEWQFLLFSPCLFSRMDSIACQGRPDFERSESKIWEVTFPAPSSSRVTGSPTSLTCSRLKISSKCIPHTCYGQSDWRFCNNLCIHQNTNLTAANTNDKITAIVLYNLQASSFFGISIPSYPQFNSRFTPLSSNEMNLLHTISVNIYLMLHPEPRIFQTSSITS